MPRRTARDARRRALGQNLLVDDAAIAAVVDLGAGRGALTHAVAKTGARVVAVELDPLHARHLRSKGFEVEHGDALALPFPDRPFRVVSSAPYGIGTKLVRRLLTEAHLLTDASIVLQREAARRLAGRPRTSRFAATYAPWFDLRTTRDIDRRAFHPVPSVDSTVLRIVPRSRPLLSPAAFERYERFLRHSFRPGLPPEAYAALFTSSSPRARRAGTS